MNTQAASYPRYIRVSQFVLDLVKGPPTRASVLMTAEDLGYMGRQQHVLLDDDEPKLLFGTGIFQVNEDDTLTLVKQKFDTSG